VLPRILLFLSHLIVAGSRAIVPKTKIGIRFALAVEEFLAVLPLRIVRIPDFEPARLIGKVRIVLTLCDYAFQIVIADKLEKALAVTLDMIAVEQSLAARWQDRTEFMLTLG
jgi:hypothetical protein